jgi:hypothetical protein
LLADATDNAALKDRLEGGLVLQPGHDEIRARDSGAGLKLYSYFNDTRVRSFILNGAPFEIQNQYLADNLKRLPR